MEAGEIQGLELLEKWKEGERRKRRAEKGLDRDGEGDSIEEDEEDWKAWDMVEDMDSDDSGGWIDVQSDGSDVDVSDSDEDKKPPAKRMEQKTRASPGLK